MAPPQVISNSSRRSNKIILILLNCAMLTFGNIGGPLIMRLYYIHGGKRNWLNAWLETVGWPIMFLPLIISYLRRLRKEGSDAKPILITPRVTTAAGGDRYSDGPRQLSTHRRNSETPCFNSYSDICNALLYLLSF